MCNNVHNQKAASRVFLSFVSFLMSSLCSGHLNFHLVYKCFERKTCWHLYKATGYTKISVLLLGNSEVGSRKTSLGRICKTQRIIFTFLSVSRLVSELPKLCHLHKITKYFIYHSYLRNSSRYQVKAIQ